MNYIYFSVRKIVNPMKPFKTNVNIKDFKFTNQELKGVWKKNIYGFWELNKELVFSEQIGLDIDGDIKTFYSSSAIATGCGYNYSHLIRDNNTLLLGHLIHLKCEIAV